MTGYTKLFGSLVSSSIWGASDTTRIVWITMLAMSDQHGEVSASLVGLARLAGVSIESTQRAIDEFTSPDPYSRTKDHEGRRIEATASGWRLLNYSAYRMRLSRETLREQTALRVARHRARQADVTHGNADVTHGNADVTHGNACNDKQKQKQKQKHVTLSIPSLEELAAYAAEIGMSADEAGSMHDFYSSKGWKVGSATMKDWRAAARGWHRRSQERVRPAERREGKEAISLEGGLK